MTERRQLDQEEISACLRARKRLEQDLEYQNYLLHHSQLMLQEGLLANYNKGIREYNDKMNEAKQQVSAAEASLAIIKDQLDNGVEIKEQPKEPDDDITSDTSGEEEDS